MTKQQQELNSYMYFKGVMYTTSPYLTRYRRATNSLAFIKELCVIAYIRQRCGFKTTVTKAIQNREFNFCNKSSAAAGLENFSWSRRLTCKLIIRTCNNVKARNTGTCVSYN